MVPRRPGVSSFWFDHAKIKFDENQNEFLRLQVDKSVLISKKKHVISDNFYKCFRISKKLQKLNFQ